MNTFKLLAVLVDSESEFHKTVPQYSNDCFNMFVLGRGMYTPQNLVQNIFGGMREQIL